MISSEVREAGLSSLDRDAERYASRFAGTFRPFVQDQLDLGRFASVQQQIYNDRITESTDLEYGIVGGDTGFIGELARRAFAAGIIGFWTPDYEKELTETEKAIATEELASEGLGEPRPTPKFLDQPFFIEALTENELKDKMAYWYKVGARDRTGGYVDERRKLDEKEKDNE